MKIRQSIQEKEFLRAYHLKSNVKKFNISYLDKSIKPIYYIPDAITTFNNRTCWIEFKGWHKNMNVYLLKKKLIINYCIKKNYVFVQVTKRKNYIWKYYNK